MPPTYDRRMLLAVDIGNTNLTLGIVEGGALDVRPAGGHDAARRTADELEVLLDGLLALDGHALARRLGDGRRARSCRRRPRRWSEVAARLDIPAPRRLVGHRADRDPRRPPGRGGRGPDRQRARGRAALRGAGGRRRLRHRDDLRLRRRRMARSWAGRSPPGSSSGSTRSPPARRSCRGSSCAPRTGRSPATPSARSRPGRCSGTRRWSPGSSRGSGAELAEAGGRRPGPTSA